MITVEQSLCVLFWNTIRAVALKKLVEGVSALLTLIPGVGGLENCAIMRVGSPENCAILWVGGTHDSVWRKFCGCMV